MTSLSIPHDRLLQNDIGREIRIVSVTSPSALGGTVTLQDDAVIYETPKTDILDRLTDTFTYNARNRFGGEDSATVTIILSSIVVARDNVQAVINYDGIEVTPHADLLGNDTGLTLTVTGVSNPINGSVVLDASNVTFTPADPKLLEVEKTYVTHRRSVTSEYNSNGDVYARSLTWDQNNINPLEVGDYAVMSTLRLGSTEIEPGWTLVADSAQAKLYTRVLDQAYVDRHKSPEFMDSLAYYPYVITPMADDSLPKPMAQIRTFKVPENIPVDDFLLMSYAKTTSGETHYFEPPGEISDEQDFYRDVLIDAFGPSGENGTDTSVPSAQIYTTATFSEDNLNGRKAEYIGNRYFLSIEGDTAGRLHSDGANTFSETGYISSVSNAYSTAYALREVPGPTTVPGGYTYTVTDQYGASDSAQVSIPIQVKINAEPQRVRQVGQYIADSGYAFVPDDVLPTSFVICANFKARETYDINWTPSYNEPLDPLPGWTFLANTGANLDCAGSIAYRAASGLTDPRQIEGYRGVIGTPGMASTIGIELFADPGETWEDIFVSAHANVASINAADAPYICPTVNIPEGCTCLTIVTTRSWQCAVQVSGGDAHKYTYSRRDWVGLATFLVHSTTAPAHIAVTSGKSTRPTIEIATIQVIVRNRK